MCAAWQLSVPAMGLTCFDHCQPGSKVARPTGAPCRLTRSRWPLLSLNGRVSSGELMLLRIMAPINALPVVTCDASMHRTDRLRQKYIGIGSFGPVEPMGPQCR